jgi:hypothetical protein
VKDWTSQRLGLLDSIRSEGRREHIKKKLIILQYGQSLLDALEFCSDMVTTVDLQKIM